MIKKSYDIKQYSPLFSWAKGYQRLAEKQRAQLSELCEKCDAAAALIFHAALSAVEFSLFKAAQQSTMKEELQQMPQNWKNKTKLGEYTGKNYREIKQTRKKAFILIIIYKKLVK